MRLDKGKHTRIDEGKEMDDNEQKRKRVPGK